jgi:transcriptional regulator with AAA-type ATPase domain
MMANPAGTRLLEGVDHGLLWEHAARAVTSGTEQTSLVALRGGQTVEARCHPVEEGGKVVGALIEVGATVRPSPQPAPETPGAPALAGRSPGWRHALRLARESGSTDLPVLICGEPGVGKRSLALAIAGATAPAMVDASLEPVDGTPEWLRTVRGALTAGGTVLLLHLEALGAGAARALCGLLDAAEAAPTPPRLIGTVTTDGGDRMPLPQGLADRIAAVRIHIPPLRERPEDIPDLVQALTRRHAPPRAVPRWRSDAIQALLRLDWPGNVRELDKVVRAQVRGGRPGDIALADLPDEIRAAVARRRLSRIQEAELQTIHAALEQAGGNKTKAAEALGISRATLYRRFRSYGIELDRQMY